MKKKFTDKEIEMLQEMVDFPEAYKLTPKGVDTIESILKKITEINS
jgi:hypothetical protein